MLKIGVLGAGHLGKIHLKCIEMVEEGKFQLVGFYDASKEVRDEVEQSTGIPAFDSIDELIAAVDVIDIVTPTLSHFECACKAIRNSKHVFIEKPITNTVEEAKILMNLQHEADVMVQVGHVERFNPAFREAIQHLDSPKFIESHRLSQFNPRGTDVSVVLDLMIHDIDIILSVVKGNVINVHASGVSVLSDTPDIANARLEFDNGCVANLTASRISLKNMRKSRFFQKDAYISVDFFEKKTEVVKMKDVQGDADPFALIISMGEGKSDKEIIFDRPDIKDSNAIRDELSSFADAIMSKTEPVVSIDDGYNALEVAHRILEKVRLSTEKMV